MPELPEVETVRRQLKKLVLNKPIIGVTSNYEKIFNGNIKELEKVLTNNEIIDVERYGKYLVFILKDNHVLISHLRMEGKYFVKNEGDDVRPAGGGGSGWPAGRDGSDAAVVGCAARNSTG